MPTVPPDAAALRADVAAKVRKLLAQAEDPAATPEEASAFTAKAQALMTKYSIDVAMLADASTADRVTADAWRIEGPYAAHKVAIVNAVGQANQCRAVYTDLAGGSKRIDVVGFPSDVEWVKTLSRSLELQLLRGLTDAVRAKPEGVHGRTYAAGFAHGFVAEVSERLRAARRQAVAEADAERRKAAGAGSGTSAALVLVARADRVDGEYRVRFPQTRTVRRYARLQSWSGYEPGRQAGRRAQLARAGVGARRGLPGA